MKKFRCLALLLSCLLAVQCFFLPASAQMETTETLETLPTESADMTAQTADIPFGQVLAERIVAYRQQNGPFRAIEEITKVEGIGEKKADAILELITVGG